MLVYLDDLLIYSDLAENHLQHFEIVLQRLEENALYVWKSKCELTRQQTEFLGLQIKVSDISLGEERRKLVRGGPIPKNISELISFVGLLQLFKRFIKNFSHVPALLTNLM